MRTKLLLFVLVLAGLLYLTNRVAGNYLSSLVDQQLQQISAADDQVEYRYQSLQINPALGSLKIKELSYHDHQILIEAKEVRGSLTWADMWRVIRHGSENPISRIHTFRITATSLTAYITQQDTGLTPAPEYENSTNSMGNPSDNPASQDTISPVIAIRSLSLLYNGRMDELLELNRLSQPPVHNHRISVSMSDVSAQGGFQSQLQSIPVLSDYNIPENLDRVSFQIRYRADRRSAQLTTLRIQSPDLSFKAGGDIHYGDYGWPDEPESYSLYYQLDAVTHDIARIYLPGMLGGFSMDTLSVNSRLQFDRGSVSEHPLTLPGETSLYLGDIHWYPSDEMIDQFGIMFGMFGLSEKQLPVRSLRASYQISSDTIRIDNATIHTDPFDARVQILLATPPDQRADIIDGSITFIRTGADFNDFVDGLEGLFRIELPRKDGRIHFEFSGDPGSPDFNFSF